MMAYESLHLQSGAWEANQSQKQEALAILKIECGCSVAVLLLVVVGLVCSHARGMRARHMDPAFLRSGDIDVLGSRWCSVVPAVAVTSA